MEAMTWSRETSFRQRLGAHEEGEGGLDVQVAAPRMSSRPQWFLIKFPMVARCESRGCELRVSLDILADAGGLRGRPSCEIQKSH